MYGRFRVSLEASETPSVFSRSASSTSLSSVDTEARLRHQWVFLTYSQCSIESKDEFEEGFGEMLKRNDLPMATYYGCRESHKTEGIHYHVLLNFGRQPNWSFKYARNVLPVEGNECESLHIGTPRPRQKLSQYVENHVNYCEKEKGGDCFGERPVFSVEKQQERKRKWEEIGSQPTAPAKLAKLTEELLDVVLRIVSETQKANGVE
ncbi:hypothetical protein N7537_011509 [Penicillium hordei]|uniref:Geminivirus AL1 replication-associated protein catalytic domain-containing protein n=1 Tax=Penicillium hordei TaxID=40994 RepID=A0AAD6DMB2_9EURO|nr:uncharacterized protein N7537_011509 [Penicillium hordei]KAJ5588831.1 hypothetical protein N7537_011509 [Penicillium hordei]